MLKIKNNLNRKSNVCTIHNDDNPKKYYRQLIPFCNLLYFRLRNASKWCHCIYILYSIYIYIQCTSRILGKILQFILMKSINLNAKFCWKLVGTCYKFGFLLKVENSSEQADAEQIDIIVNLRKTQFFHKYHVRNIKLYTEKFRKMALNRCAYANFKNIYNKSHHIFTFFI